MKAILQYLVLAAAAFALIAVGVLALHVNRRVDALADNLDGAVGAIHSAATQLQQEALDTSHNTNAALIQIGLAADNVRRASMRQEEYSNKMVKILDHVDTAVQANSESAGELLSAATKAVTDLDTNSEPVLLEARDAMHNFGELPNDPSIRRAFQEAANSAANTDKATADFAALIHDLSHPRPSPKWLRALSIGISILKGTALAGQSAPVFGR